MAELDQKKIVEQLQSISTVFDDMADTPENIAIKEFVDRSKVAAEKLEPQVLSEIWSFYSQCEAVTPKGKLGAGIVEKMQLSIFSSIANALERHEGKALVDPALMPYQFRK